MSTAYTDDSCLQGMHYKSCLRNISDIVSLMNLLGLTDYPNKSVLLPTQQIVFLGFILCSISMTIRPTPEKCQKVVELGHQILARKRVTIREFAQLIGKLVALEQGVEYAPLYYKSLKKVKDEQLKGHYGKFDSFMTIPKYLYPVIDWWIRNVFHSYKELSYGQPQLILYSDSSTNGWRAFNETDNIHTGGEWSAEDQTLHINIEHWN